MEKTCTHCWKESKRAEHDELLDLRKEVAEHSYMTRTGALTANRNVTVPDGG